MGVPDNGPLIAGTTWSLTFLCGAFLALRLYAKLSRKQGLWWDDHVLVVSWILLLAEAITTQVGVNLGFGKRTVDIPLANQPTIGLGVTVVASISCFASTLSKISFGITLLRLTSGWLRWFVWFCIVTLFLVMIPSATLSWLQCTPVEKAWNPIIEGKCWPAYITINYGIFNAGWCTLADFALALLPWKLIWGLQLKFREKIGVGIAMSMGLLAGICAIVKGVYLMQLRQKDFYYNGKDVVIWTVVETATAIIAASIPILRVFFKDAVRSYNKSHGKSYNHSNATVPLSHLSHSHPHNHTATILSLGKDKESGWTTLEPIEDGDGASQRGMLRYEEGRLMSPGLAIGSPGILQTSSFTITIDEDRKSWHKGLG